MLLPEDELRPEEGLLPDGLPLDVLLPEGLLPEGLPLEDLLPLLELPPEGLLYSLMT